ncbi:hypothetical protein J7E87_22875 [Streptomyces sp. ISL-1]|uniref:DinB/UmuC family translesion DNA polymerase n=1 Tax=Streptomyces sp. ISL-1 TaxID=2817657 RepID=UPI001BE85065|nr:hypothetical protein [Streptomyces sp. ISL-1]MBT2392191.1 hypothetical protein [Streptomyces sp. ISL-1]
MGPSTAGLLTRHGLHTIGAVADTPLGTLQPLLGKATGRLIHERARAEDPRPVTPPSTGALLRRRPRLPPATNSTPTRHRQAVLAVAEQLGARLRKERQVASRLTLTARYADRSTTVRTRRLPEPTNHTAALARTAYDIYTTLGLQRARVRGIALRAEDIQGAERATRQLTFDPGDDRAHRIEAAADKVRARFSAGVVMPAALAHPPQ